MPNAAQYRDAAARSRAVGEHSLRQAAGMVRWPLASHLGAGPVADVVTAALRSAADHLTVASAELDRLARVCDARAVICDDFRRAMQQHLALEPIERLATTRPVPPHAWVSL